MFSGSITCLVKIPGMTNKGIRHPSGGTKNPGNLPVMRMKLLLTGIFYRDEAISPGEIMLLGEIQEAESYKGGAIPLINSK